MSQVRRAGPPWFFSNIVTSTSARASGRPTAFRRYVCANRRASRPRTSPPRGPGSSVRSRRSWRSRYARTRTRSNMAVQPELSVVIPTYNRLDTLRYVVPSLLGNSLRAEDKRVRHLPGPYTGRAMARNAGIEAARGEVVMFTDADIIADPALLERHLAHHAAAR